MIKKESDRMRILFAASSAILITACSSTTVITETEPAPISEPVALTEVPGAFELAMGTVDQLVVAGNEPTAIDRLTQLLGVPDLTENEKAAALYRRGELRLGAGNDVEGAMYDFNELVSTYGDNPLSDEAGLWLAEATLETKALKAAIASGELSPTEEFEALFRLGEHQDAADLMLARNLSRGPDYLVDMFQIGYLCDDPELTGPTYDLVEPDGTMRSVRFCEFGK
ncbi:MAG: hypothetical protein AAF768_04145 [Pseudomonadota bacterium]